VGEYFVVVFFKFTSMGAGNSGQREGGFKFPSYEERGGEDGDFLPPEIEVLCLRCINGGMNEADLRALVAATVAYGVDLQNDRPNNHPLCDSRGLVFQRLGALWGRAMPFAVVLKLQRFYSEEDQRVLRESGGVEGSMATSRARWKAMGLS
jgi:hypothetical protein